MCIDAMELLLISNAVKGVSVVVGMFGVLLSYPGGICTGCQGPFINPPLPI